MINFLYDTFLVLLFLLALPKLLWNYVRHHKYHESFRQRFGKTDFPKRNSEDEYIIWIHSISVGETKAAAALLKNLPAKYKNARIVFSCITETGMREAKKSLKGVSDFFFLPLDFSWIIGKCVRQIRPNLTILVEGEFWYNWLRILKEQKSCIVLVNGKISAKSAKRFSYFKTMKNKLFSLVDFYAVQTQEYKNRFLSLGVMERKIEVTGNLKFDFTSHVLSEDEKRQWMRTLGIHQSDYVVVLGSTHEGEEEGILFAIRHLWEKIPDMKILLVPRHPERFLQVRNILEKQSVSFAVYTDKTDKTDAKIILIDAMGILSTCYQLAKSAVVAGSFTSKVGGHNILEPLEFGVPVLFGPHMFTQNELKNMVLEHHAGLQVELADLEKTLLILNRDESLYEKMSRNGLNLLKQVKGVSIRTWSYIEKETM